MAEALIENPSGYAALQDSDEDSAVTTISGVALGANDVTRGQSGILKRWPDETLREAAETLQGKPLVVDHINHSVDSVKGQVTKAGFKEGVGVIFEGEIDDDELASKIENEWLDVSPRILHEPVEEMQVEGEGDDPVHVVGDIEEFVNLSLVPRGAAPSNEVSVGEHEDLSAEDLRNLVVGAITESLSEGEDAPLDIEVDVTVSSDGAVLASEEVLSGILTDSSTDNLARHQVHEPEFSDTREAPWNEPSLEDFTDESWDDLSQDERSDIADHFLGSKTGFPPDNFGDLFLPVVDSEGNLVLNALQNAKARVGQVSGLSDEDQNRAENIIDNLANDNFEDADFGEEDNEMEDDIEFEVEEAGLHTFRMSVFDRPVPEDEANSAANSLSNIDGVEAIAKGGEDRPQVVVVVDPDEIDGNLNDDIRSALDDTPFLVREEFDWVERVVRNEGDRLSEDSPLSDVEFLEDESQGIDPDDLSELEILL